MWHSVKQMKVIRSQKSVTRESRAENAEFEPVSGRAVATGLASLPSLRFGWAVYYRVLGKRISLEIPDGLGTKYLFDLNGRG